MIFNRIKDKIRRKTKNSSKIIPLIIALVIVIIPAMVFLVSLIFRLLWNWLMPEIFGLPEITILQSIGLLILGRFLFGSFINSKHENKSSSKGVSINLNGGECMRWWEHSGKEIFNDFKNKNDDTEVYENDK